MPGQQQARLQKYDVPGTELETVVGIGEIAPNMLIVRKGAPLASPAK